MAELNSFLTGIADAIRSKKGTTDKINASNFASEIENLQSSVGETYKGEYEVIPSVLEQTLETKNKYLTNNVTVTTIPFSKVSNTSGGNTVTIGVAPIDTNGETLILKL